MRDSGLVGAQSWKELELGKGGARKGQESKSSSRKARWWQSHRWPVAVTFAESRCKSWGSGAAALQATLAEIGGRRAGGRERGKRTNQPQTEDQQGEWSSLSARGSGAEIKVLRVQRQGKRGAGGWKEVQ